MEIFDDGEKKPASKPPPNFLNRNKNDGEKIEVKKEKTKEELFEMRKNMMKKRVTKNEAQPESQTKISNNAPIKVDMKGDRSA
jgi:hypothetical protein